MSTLTPFYVYEPDPECDNCEHGKAVTTEDFACFHICFIPHDKSEEDSCSKYRFSMIAIEAKKMERIEKNKKPEQMRIL